MTIAWRLQDMHPEMERDIEAFIYFNVIITAVAAYYHEKISKKLQITDIRMVIIMSVASFIIFSAEMLFIFTPNLGYPFSLVDAPANTKPQGNTLPGFFMISLGLLGLWAARVQWAEDQKYFGGIWPTIRRATIGVVFLLIGMFSLLAEY